jgi:hypothetical protein
LIKFGTLNDTSEIFSVLIAGCWRKHYFLRFRALCIVSIFL